MGMTYEDKPDSESLAGAIETISKQLREFDRGLQAWTRLSNDQKKDGKKYPKPVFAPNPVRVRKILKAAASLSTYQRMTANDAQVRRMVAMIRRQRDESSDPEAPIWRVLEILAQKHLTLEPEHLVVTAEGNMTAFRCPACHGMTILSYATDYYHCSKCGQKIHTYAEPGLCGIIQGEVE